MDKPFNVRAASEAIFQIMQQLGINTTRPSNDSWINHENAEHSVICLGCNFIQCSVTAKGFSMYSAHAVFPAWSKRSKSFKEFRKQMAHVLFYMR